MKKEPEKEPTQLQKKLQGRKPVPVEYPENKEPVDTSKWATPAKQEPKKDV